MTTSTAWNRAVIFSASLVIGPLACGHDDKGDDDAADDGSSDGDDGSSGGNSASADGGSASADGGSASADGGSADGGGTTGAASADDGGGMCDGDWSLGSVPFTGEGFLVECDASPPMNCIDGYYINFADDSCFCMPECSSGGLSVGDNCTTDGAVVCTAIANNSGTSSGNFCVPTEWNLCGP